MLISMKEMVNMASPGKFAVGSFHAMNLEQIQGILEAAVEKRSPVIIALDEPAAMYAGVGPFMALVGELAQDIPVAVSVILDHVHDIDLISLALEKNCLGILADFRGRPAEDSLDKLKKIRSLCEGKGAFLEIEVMDTTLNEDELIGYIGNVMMEASPDSFCISLPSEERERPGKQVFDLIKNIKSATDVLVSLAGAGRWAEEDIASAIDVGVWKISVGTRLNIAFTYGLKSYLDENPAKIHPRAYLGWARDHLRDETINCLRSFKTTYIAESK